MGFTNVKVRVINPENKEGFEIGALVDTGTLYSIIPKSLLENIGIESMIFDI